MSGSKNPFLNPVDRLEEINERTLKIWEKIIRILCPPVADGTIPKGLNPPPPVTPPVPPNPGDKPTIAPPPRVIYVPTGNGYRPDVDITIKNPPIIPPRRLPKEADGQSPTKTPKKRSISIKTALYDEIHGQLLTFPITQKPVQFKEYELDGFAEKMRLILETSANYFGNWLAVQQGETLPKKYPKPTIFDGTALITPNYLAGLSGNIGLMYGTKALAMLASAYQVSRKNAYQPVSGYVPLEIQISIEDIPDFDPFFLTDPGIENSGLGKIRTAVGGMEFPIAVPRSLIQHTDADLDKILDQKIKLLKAEKGKHPEASKLGRAIKDAIEEAQKQKEGKEVYRTLENIPQQISWMVSVLDEVLGSFPVSITLKDSDLIKVGEEEQKIRVPNIAESLAELTGMALLNHSATELSINTLVRILCETGTGRQQSIKNYYLLDVIRDYLGCATQEKQIQVPFAYDPVLDLGKDQKDEFAKFLTPKTVDIDIEELDEKQSLQRWLVQIDSIYALCRAYMTRPARNKTEVYKYLKDIASQFISIADDNGNTPPDEFDQFLERIETGFTTQDGNTLENKPYGRDYTERPRIVRLTKKNDAQEGQ